MKALIPVVLCDETPDGKSVRFWCAWCKHQHAHTKTDPMGHREASQCVEPSSPYKATGYDLVLRSDFPRWAKERLQWSQEKWEDHMVTWDFTRGPMPD